MNICGCRCVAYTNDFSKVQILAGHAILGYKMLFQNKTIRFIGNLLYRLHLYLQNVSSCMILGQGLKITHVIGRRANDDL